MTLEVLFAQAGQGRTFLLMVLCGAAAGLCIHLAGFLHQVNGWLGMAADLLCGLGLTLALGQILLGSGEGLRFYGLLGLCIGGVLYAAGPGPAVGWIGRRCLGRRKKVVPQPEKPAPAKAGERAPA